LNTGENDGDFEVSEWGSSLVHSVSPKVKRALAASAVRMNSVAIELRPKKRINAVVVMEG